MVPGRCRVWLSQITQIVSTDEFDPSDLSRPGYILAMATSEKSRQRSERQLRENVLLPGEELLDFADGNTMVQRSGRSVSRLGTIFVTDSRVGIFVWQRIGGFDLTDLSYDLVSSVESGVEMFRGTLTINAAGKSLWLGTGRQDAPRLANLIRECIAQSELGDMAKTSDGRNRLSKQAVSSTAAEHSVVAQSLSSVADDLTKFTALHDLGVMGDEEFDLIRQRLVSQAVVLAGETDPPGTAAPDTPSPLTQGPRPYRRLWEEGPRQGSVDQSVEEFTQDGGMEKPAAEAAEGALRDESEPEVIAQRSVERQDTGGVVPRSGDEPLIPMTLKGLKQPKKKGHLSLTTRVQTPKGKRKAGATTQVFKDDDAGYLDWMSSHSGGFVLNANRTPNAAYVVLHLASCSSISGEPAKGRSWTADYLKVCADDRLSIERWCQQQVGATPSQCGRCHP